jgi:hypothetical protein
MPGEDPELETEDPDSEAPLPPSFKVIRKRLCTLEGFPVLHFLNLLGGLKMRCFCSAGARKTFSGRGRNIILPRNERRRAGSRHLDLAALLASDRAFIFRKSSCSKIRSEQHHQEQSISSNNRRKQQQGLCNRCVVAADLPFGSSHLSSRCYCCCCCCFC